MDLSPNRLFPNVCSSAKRGVVIEERRERAVSEERRGGRKDRGRLERLERGGKEPLTNDSIGERERKRERGDQGREVKGRGGQSGGQRAGTRSRERRQRELDYKMAIEKEYYYYNQNKNQNRAIKMEDLGRFEGEEEVLNNKISSLTKDLEDISGRLKNEREVKKRVREMDLEGFKLKSEIQRLKEENAAKARDLGEMKGLLFKKNDKLSSLKAEIDATEGQLKGQKDLVSFLKSSTLERKDINAILTKKYGRELEVLSDQMKWLQESEAKSVSLSKQLDQDLLSVKSKLASVRKENSALLEHQGRLNASIGELNVQIVGISEEIATHNQTNDTNNKKIEENIVLFKQIDTDYQQVMDKLAQMQSSLQRLQAENSQLKKGVTSS